MDNSHEEDHKILSMG
jgi:hypothetical protein